MHAVVVKATVADLDAAQEALRSEVAPRVAQVPGFVAGYWLEPKEGKGMSVVVFESEEAARSAAANIQPPPQVTIDSVEVREVVASA